MFLLFYLPVKEHLIEQKIDRHKVKFFSDARGRGKYGEKVNITIIKAAFAFVSNITSESWCSFLFKVRCHATIISVIAAFM